MARSSWKGPYISSAIIRYLKRYSADDSQKKPIKCWARGSTIIPQMVGYIFNVHNGKGFLKVECTESRIGFKLGEFAPTKQTARHSEKLMQKTKSLHKK
jgi:small subunit ribosomal protein S19